MSNTYMPLYGVFDTSSGSLQGVCPVSGTVSSIGGSPVAITGTASVGYTLTATLATGWTAAGYQWTRDGTNISGATGSTYTVISGDVGHILSVTVTGLVYVPTGKTVASGGATLPAYVLASETSAIATAMTASGQTPNAQRQYTHDRWIKKMKAQGVWAKLSRLWIVGDTPGQTLINWITPGTGDLTVGGVPVFTAPAAPFSGTASNTAGGYKATANTMYLDTGVTLAQLRGAGTFSFGVYSGTSASAFVDFGAADTTASALIYTSDGAGGMSSKACSVGGTYGPTDGSGFHAVVRNSATTVTSYHNSLNLGSRTDNIANPTTGTSTMRFLTAATYATNTGRPFQGGFIAMQPLTDDDIDMLYRAMRSIIESVQYGDVLLNEAGYAPAAVGTQAVVYGWTLQGIHAAFELARQGKTVALVGGWRDISLGALGGVSANGLNRTDMQTRSAIGGLANLTLTRCNGASVVTDNSTSINTDPKVVNWICRQMLDPARTGGQNVQVYATGGIVSASKTGTTITSISTLDGRTFTASQFIDASYEGDLMAAALPTSGWTTGREAAGTGTEALGGFQGYLAANLPQKASDSSFYTIDPFITPGVQASGTIAQVLPTFPSETVGQGDGNSQAFCFRMTVVTNTHYGLPMPTTPPPGYSSSNYEFWGRMAAAFTAASKTYTTQDAFLNVPVMSGIQDLNNVGTVGMDYQNHSGDYINAATYADRETSWQAHLNFAKGYLYYFGQDSDSRISGQPVRTTVQTWYLPSDTYLDPHPNDQPYWPGQLYVREMRRLVGDFVVTGNDLVKTDGTVPRSTNTVGTSTYNIDSHSIGRYAYNNSGTWQVVCEGLFTTSDGGVNSISPIPFEACVPQVTHCTNLSVAFCFSATHVAFGAIRMEFPSAQIAQSIGMAAAIAIENGSTIQAVPYATLRTRLLSSPSLAGEVAPVLPQTN